MRTGHTILLAGALFLAAPAVAQDPLSTVDGVADQLPNETIVGEVVAEVRASVRGHMVELQSEIRALRADVADDLASARAAYADGRAQARVAYDACLASAAESLEARAECRATARARLAELRAEALLVKDELLAQLRLELADATTTTCNAIALDVKEILVSRNLQHLRLRAFVQTTPLGKCGETLLSEVAATDGVPEQTPVRTGVSVSVPVRATVPTAPTAPTAPAMPSVPG